MKKLLIKSSIALSFVMLLSACQNEANTQANQAAQTTESTEETSNQEDELTLYIVRHGKTMLNTTDRVQGWSDAVLTPAGEEVVTNAGVGLKDIDFQNAYSSDSGRAIQTADLILDENEQTNEIQVQKDSGLREFNFGTYEGDLNDSMWQDVADEQGVTLEEFQANMDPEVFADSVAKLDKEQMEENNVEEEINWPAEDYETISDRLTNSLDQIVADETQENGSGNVLITSHGLSITALLDTLFDGFEAPADGLDNASVNIIKYKDNDYSLESVNDMSYAEQGEKAQSD
ncbi:phosphoglycerate mutase family protein [Tetragenococcus halophilus subsp. halophilus]|uniref:Phosphoglycerate mutase family protein n=2 Tax=Tetragenococcus halophilus TaxID=51669 RepID=A0A2H6CQZ2_TETHA|nr:histidine phosphatase family protein [Tetragenococcus halophilus]MCF1601612.1 phosphoglycerate mutase family protein [Tetragenococcus halophilus]MCF1674875.1 phosphoglycerate mutase family protein [Tetragenococcus halophilus]MDN5831909.1 phosphoglycerate mutase family protein [Tetragenococcus halophilus]MDN6112771.1 phosphoglycerate mutase family protein [Tetragenococcus halophilus]MDN6204550.1 phosphoglycerate mutase family protein [Tetragenococcus halophilus]